MNVTFTSKKETVIEMAQRAVEKAHGDGIRAAVQMIRDYKDTLPIDDILKTLEDLANKRNGGAK